MKNRITKAELIPSARHRNNTMLAASASLSDNNKLSEEDKLSSEEIVKWMSPCETKTIQELALMIKKTGLYENVSEKEFNDMIISRRPLELLFMANASIYSSL